ncbi:MAG: hypothetical protein LC107_13735 [Chitinophagales bacterium]|nr:hypothetical protein [Chitinophagales bacterium]
MSDKIKIIIFFVFGFLSIAEAQQNDNSPYSRFGIGDIADDHFNNTRHMGGLGASYIDGYSINIVNPASYAFLNATAFDVGIFAKATSLKDNNYKSNIWTGNLDYLSLAFPLTNPINAAYDGIVRKYKWAMNITLKPHSNVNYNISSVDSTSVGKPFNRNYLGSGGSYKLLWGNAINYKRFGLGLNMGYLFGNMNYTRNVIFDDTDYAYNDYYSNDYNIKGFIWNAGLIYTDILNKGEIEKNKITPIKRISAGFHFNSNSAFSTSSNINHFLVQHITSGTDIIDTVNIAKDIKGKGKLPAEIGVGATYYNGEKYAIGFNYERSLWSQYFNEGSGEIKGSLTDVNKFTIGGYYRPDYKSYDNYFKRVYYRYGVYYTSNPKEFNGEAVNAYGLTLGMGMPFVFQRKVSSVNFGITAGTRGVNAPIQEKFVKFSLGVTFNDDEWFLQRKYN